METIQLINRIIGLLFFLCLSYQAVYLLLPFIQRDKPHGPIVLHRYAILIAARNEEAVLPHLLDTLRGQDYPTDCFTVFVIADNCTDRTAEVARAGGAVVFERQDKVRVGKGYALNALLSEIVARYGAEAFDGYMVFDADNLLAPDFLSAMNRTFSDGYRIITSYRNSKNYGDNWISAGYGLCFLRDSCFLNHSRMLIGSSCSVAGTGFCFAREVLEAAGGWNFFLLTEDTEFTADCILRRERIGYCSEAMLWDEQPVRFSQSFRQRMRWVRGYLQVLGKYGGGLVRGIFSKNGFSCFDMLMNTLPLFALGIVGILLQAGALAAAVITHAPVLPVLWQGIWGAVSSYLGLFAVGTLTTVSQWDKINTSPLRKLGYLFTFPLLVMTYIPISVAAVLRPVEWKPIEHKAAVSLEEVKTRQR